MSVRFQILVLALIGLTAVVLAGFAATGDIRPALAAGLFGAILARIGFALYAGLPKPQPGRSQRHPHWRHGSAA